MSPIEKEMRRISVDTEINILEIRITEVRSMVEHLRGAIGLKNKVTNTYEAYLLALETRRDMFIEEKRINREKDNEL